MRSILVAGAALTAAMLFSAPASAFEIDSSAPVGGGSSFNLNIDEFNRPAPGTVLERFADTHDKSQPGALQVFGNDIGGTYGIPNTIPGPAAQPPNWFFSSPSFRAAR
jgi:hypothetical protein